MNELFIIAGFLALLANIFYCVFWVSREVWRYFEDGNKEIKEDLDRFTQQEEYLKMLHSDFNDGRRPWSLSIPKENHMIDAAIEQIKKHGYTEFGVDFGPLPDCDNTLKVCFPVPGIPDSRGDVYSQDAVDSMRRMEEATRKGELFHFKENNWLDKKWLEEVNKIDPEKFDQLKVRDHVSSDWITPEMKKEIIRYKPKPIFDLNIESKEVKDEKYSINNIKTLKVNENYFDHEWREFRVIEITKSVVSVIYTVNEQECMLIVNNCLSDQFYKKA